MPFNQELANQLSNFLAGDLSLPAYRQAMMRFRLEKLESVQDWDKNFVYEFETRYAQLKAEAITEYQFRQLLGYAAASQTVSTQHPEVQFQLESTERKPPQSVVSSSVSQTSTERTLQLV
jgi:hypothetical protein